MLKDQEGKIRTRKVAKKVKELNSMEGFEGIPRRLHKLVNSRTRVKISQAITGLLAQQPCHNTVNMIERDW